jgi:hypothetical protein
LLYIGIAPRDAVSKALLRSRLWRQHISGNLASSTFRFGLGALLFLNGRFLAGRNSPAVRGIQATALTGDAPWNPRGRIVLVWRSLAMR